ncbi:MAG: ABC transporter permease [Clostridia bacterium]|nr:ABC transporter permease [Clostridia bacterium]
MKQFGLVLSFELNGYFKNKVFIGTTIFLVAVIVIVMFAPRIITSFESDGPGQVETDRPVMLISAGDETDRYVKLFASGFPGYEVKGFSGSRTELEDEVFIGAADCAFSVEPGSGAGEEKVVYLVNNLSLYDSTAQEAEGLIFSYRISRAMSEHGMSDAEIESVMRSDAGIETVSLGNDQMNSFFYTYIMIFTLYMVILLYGQMIATGVASEKSSRAMELLITSAKPVSMMFGKVFAACAAGLFQLAAVFGSAILFYALNKTSWADVPIIRSIFDMPLSLFVFMLVFFLLGFLLYAFMFGAVGSTVSKLEETGSAIMPVTLIFVIGFVVVMMSLASGSVDSGLMRICSFIPFTSPMAMFTRIAMGSVSTAEISVSILILALTGAFIGYAAAKIYRVGVLLYGTRPKLGAVVKAAFRK